MLGRKFVNTQDAGCFLLRFALSFFSHSVYRWCFFGAGLCLLMVCFAFRIRCVYLWCAWCFAELPNFFSRSYTICKKVLQVCLVGHHGFGGCDATGPSQGVYRLCSLFWSSCLVTESRSSFIRISSESFFQSRLMCNITCAALPRLRLKCSCEVGFLCAACVFGFLAFGIVVLFFYRSSRSFARSYIITYTICRKCLGFH